MNGLLLDLTVDYTSNGSAVTLTSGAAVGDEIEVVAYNTFSVGDALNQAAADARYEPVDSAYTKAEADTRYVNTAGDTMTGNLVVKQSGSTFTPNGNTVALFQRNAATGSGAMVSILSGRSSAADLNFADAEDEDVGRIRYNHSDNSMLFSTSGTERLKIDSSGRVTMPTQPAFLVQPSSQQSNIAANGNNTTIALGTERFDAGSNFSSNVFTAPVTGKYMLCANLYLVNIDSGMNYMQLTLNTSNRLYYFAFDTGSTDADPNRITFQVNVVADMDASDQSWLGILQSGGTAQTDVATESYFSGALIC
jgi:hypothetical protein